MSKDRVGTQLTCVAQMVRDRAESCSEGGRDFFRDDTIMPGTCHLAIASQRKRVAQSIGKIRLFRRTHAPLDRARSSSRGRIERISPSGVTDLDSFRQRSHFRGPNRESRPSESSGRIVHVNGEVLRLTSRNGYEISLLFTFPFIEKVPSLVNKYVIQIT